MFKMAKKILAFDGKSSSGSPAASSASSSSAKQDKDSGGGGGGVKKSSDELNDFSKLEDDPRLPLNVRQIFKITKSWKAIARTMSKTGTAMFLNLFEQNQDLFYLFDRFQHLKGKELHESMELREHAATVMATLDQSINSLSDYDNFVTYLHSIGKFHRKVPGFRRAYFWKIEQPFLKAVKQTLDERCNETIEEIYKIAIKLIIETISEGYGEDKTDEAPARRPPGDGDGGAGSGARSPDDGEAGQSAHGGAANNNNNNGDDNNGKPAVGGPKGRGANEGREIRLGEGKCASQPTSTSASTSGTPTTAAAAAAAVAITSIPASSPAAGHLHAPSQAETKLGPTLFVLRQLLLTLMASERGKQGPRGLEMGRGETGTTASERKTPTTATKTSRRSRSSVEVEPDIEPGARSQVGAEGDAGPTRGAPVRGPIGKGWKGHEATRGSGSLINCQARFDSGTTLAGEREQQQQQQPLPPREQHEHGPGNGAHYQHNSRPNSVPLREEANSSQPKLRGSDGASLRFAIQSRRPDTWKLGGELELNNKTGGQQINGDSSAKTPSAANWATGRQPLVTAEPTEDTPRQSATWRRGQNRARKEMSSNNGILADPKSPRNSAAAGELGEMKERSLSIVSRLRIKQSSVKPSDGEPRMAAATGNHHFPPPTRVCTRSKATARRPKSNANDVADARAKLRLSTDPDDLKELIKLLMLATASRSRQTAAT